VTPTNRSDEDRFQDLYASTRPDLLAYVVRRAPTPDDAADILAETYLTAWRGLDTLPEGDRARLWLFGVARNLLLKSARQHRVRDALSERLARELRASGLGDTPSSDPRLAHLQTALDALSDEDREILTLTAWEQLTPREIAAVINVSANAVRVRLHRARTRLSRQLGEQDNMLPRSRTFQARTDQ
jgi:RNA polymerase sigma-70 factor (ECF subfamily)